MSNDETTEPAESTTGDNATASEGFATDPTDEALDLVSYDLNDDGKISPLEGARAELGLVDARLEELAEEPGIKGRIADVAHHIIDKLDND